LVNYSLKIDLRIFGMQKKSFVRCRPNSSTTTVDSSTINLFNSSLTHTSIYPPPTAID